MAAPKKSEDAVLVNVRAFEREGYDGFWRGGHKWPSTVAGRTVYVTPRLLEKLLVDKKKVAVDKDADAKLAELEAVKDKDGNVVSTQPAVLDLPDHQILDENRALEERAAAAKAESERLSALEQLEKLEAENAAKRAKLGLPDPDGSKARQAAASAKAAADAKPVHAAHAHATHESKK